MRYSIVSSEATADAENARSRLAIGLPISIPASTPSRHWSRCGFTVKIIWTEWPNCMRPSLRKKFFFPASKRNFLGFENIWISEVDAAKRRSAQSKERTPETTERRHRRLEHRRVIRETRGRIFGFQLRAGLRVRSPGRISLLELSKATFHVVLSRRRRVDGSRARARAPGRRARPPRRCRQAQRVDAQGTRPTTDPSHASPFSPKVPRSGRVAGAASRRGRRDNLLRGLPGFWWCLRRRRIAPTEPSRDVPTYPDDPASSRARLATPNAAPRTASNTR